MWSTRRRQCSVSLTRISYIEAFFQRIIYIRQAALLFTIFVLPMVSSPVFANAAPDCLNTVPSQDILWPANHKLKGVEILGVSDPDGDNVNIIVQCIQQDEPLDSTGDGHTEWDGLGVGSSSAQLRAERKGNSNGRVYHIS